MVTRPSGSICFGVVSVRGRRRVPNPPTSTMARTAQLPESVPSVAGAVVGGAVSAGSLPSGSAPSAIVEVVRAGSMKSVLPSWEGSTRSLGLASSGQRRRQGHLGAVGHEGQHVRLPVVLEPDVSDVLGEDLWFGRLGGLRRPPVQRHLPGFGAVVRLAVIAVRVGRAVGEGELAVAELDADLFGELAERRVLAGAAGAERMDVDEPVLVGVDPEGVGTDVVDVLLELAADVDAERSVPVVTVGDRRLAGRRLTVRAGEEDQHRSDHEDRDDERRVGQIATLARRPAHTGLLDPLDLLRRRRLAHTVGHGSRTSPGTRTAPVVLSARTQGCSAPPDRAGPERPCDTERKSSS